MDFAVAQPASISGTAFDDRNSNATRDAGEPVRPGTTIYLDNNGNGVRDQGTIALASLDALASIPKSVPDLATTLSTVTVTNVAGVVENVVVTLDVTHGWDSDLEIWLISPSGRQVRLFNHFAGANLTNTTFDDTAAQSIGSATAPYTGTFGPQQPLSYFKGEDPNGIWGLKIVDSDAGARAR